MVGLKFPSFFEFNRQVWEVHGGNGVNSRGCRNCRGCNRYWYFGSLLCMFMSFPCGVLPNMVHPLLNLLWLCSTFVNGDSGEQ